MALWGPASLMSPVYNINISLDIDSSYILRTENLISHGNLIKLFVKYFTVNPAFYQAALSSAIKVHSVPRHYL